MNDQASPTAVKVTLLTKFRWKIQEMQHFLRLNVHHRFIRLIGGVPADYTGGYLAHAKRELLGCKPDAEEMNKLMAEQLLELLAVFSTHGHSGFSASYAIAMFRKLAAFEPLGPLTGEDDEWAKSEMGGELTYQNKRASHVFKQEGGRAYDINGKVFIYPNGCSYTGNRSKVYIDFPYVPKTEYIKVDNEGEPICT